MPTRRTRKVARRRPRRIHGGSLKSLLSKANKWLRKSKAISKGTRFLADNDGPSWLKHVSRGARAVGYGRRVRRRRRTGGSLGGSLRLAGMGKKKPLAISY